MAPNDETLLRRLAGELAKNVSTWSEAFDANAIVRDETRSRAADHAVGVVLPGYAWLRARADERGEQARAELQPGIATAAGRVLSAASRASVALAIRSHRLATGSLPDSLDALVPSWLGSVPRDPFRTDRAALGYRPSADGSFLVWSAGEDGEDDGGDPANDDVLAITAEPRPCAALASTSPSSLK